MTSRTSIDDDGLNNSEGLAPLHLDDASTKPELLVPTPTLSGIPLRLGGFKTLSEALDYAAEGEAGFNFYNGRHGALSDVLSYKKIRTEALSVARKMRAFDLPRGSRVAIIADTKPEFVIFFMACQYVGLIPVPLPAAVNFNGREAFIYQTRLFVQDCEAKICLASDEFVKYLAEACVGLKLAFQGACRDFYDLPEDPRPLEPTSPKENAYIQYTSGSTNFPRGVIIESGSAMSNLSRILQDGIQVRVPDRCFSWLPFYHDMGLVGKMMSTLVGQGSIDCLDNRKFAIRPNIWLKLMSENKSTISFSPPFGYELCLRRLHPEQAEQYDLSHWRIAGVGAEMIRSSILNRFAEALEPAGFRKEAFTPCYGMAESSVAVTFSKLGKVFDTDSIDREKSATEGMAVQGPAEDAGTRTFVACGYPLPDHEIQIRDADHRPLSARHIGRVFVRGPSIMSGYLNKPELTSEVLVDGWLDTGDLGYCTEDGQLFIVGRGKDMIIINGRNIWPQDLEYTAEAQPSVRSGDALAFGLSDNGEDSEKAVIVIQTREKDAEKRQNLIRSIKQTIFEHSGIQCHVKLVPAHTLPRTSSGKLSRSKARFNFIQSNDGAEVANG